MQVIMFGASYVLAILVAHYYMLICIIQATLQWVYMNTFSVSIIPHLRQTGEAAVLHVIFPNARLDTDCFSPPLS